MEWLLTMDILSGFLKNINNQNKNSTFSALPHLSPTTPLTTAIANMNGHEFSVQLEMAELQIINEWKPVIARFREMNMTPDDVLLNLNSGAGDKSKSNNNRTANVKAENERPSTSKQSDVLPKCPIIAEVSMKLNFINVPEGIELQARIKNFDITTSHFRTNLANATLETNLDVSVGNDATGTAEPPVNDYDMLIDEAVQNAESDQSIPKPDPNQTKSFNPIPPNNNLHDATNERNILLLGETGAGKSTTINAFANYLKYGSFEKAKAGKFIQVIPSKFFLTNPKTDKEIEIKSGFDANERHQKNGESCTQSPVGYLFKYGNNQKIRIIDTPGMGDTRGVEVDRENFEQIMQFINHFQNLHGICILIQSNETRKTSSFRYCITELLANLHKSACKNIFFCFTFARYTNYGAGDGFAILESFLHNELHETGLRLTPGVNCFFIDNEAYRYLAAKKQFFYFDKDEMDKFDESWTKSSRNTKSMIDNIINLEPHNIELTRLLNHTQKLTILLSEPLVLLQQNLYYNIQEFQFHINTLRSLKSSWNSSAHQIQVYIYMLELENLPYEKTVCTESRCVKPVDYKAKDRSCHGICSEIQAQNGIVGSSQLKNCRKMNQDGSCISCGCNWRKHMRLTAEYKQVKRSIVKQHVHTSWRSGNSPNSVDKVLQSLNKQLIYYQNRQRELESVCAKLGYLVQKNSNTSFNKFIEPFLDKLIDEESKKIKTLPNYSDEFMQMWMHMKIGHIKRVQELSDMIYRNATADVKLQQVSAFCDKLVQFKPLNQVLLNFFNYQDKETKEFKLREIAFEN